MAPGGPFVACRIARGDDGLWSLFIGGAIVGTPHADPWKVHPRMEWVSFAHRITEDQYIVMLDAADAARPGDPLAASDAAVDFEAAPPLYQRKKS